MIVKHGSKPVVKGKSRLSTAKANPEILDLRAFLNRKSGNRKLVAIRRKSVFILWGVSMYQRQDKHIIHEDGREEWIKSESYSDSGLLTFFAACLSISLSILTCHLIISGAKNSNEAKDSRGGTVTVQESPSYMRTNQGSGN